jgi:protease-4
MKQFLKFTLASSIGLIIGVFALIIIISVLATSGESKNTKLKEEHILCLKLHGSIQDRYEESPFEINELLGEEASTLGLNNILKNIKKAKSDENIKGIYLDIGFLNAGFATIGEIRKALLNFKESGKFIVSYSETYTQRAYYLASVADDICIYPDGALEYKGLNSSTIFYTNALKKIGIEPQIIRHGKFKSAVEPFILTEMSDSNREQVTIFVNSIWDEFQENVARERNLSVKKLNEIANNLMVRTPKDALDLGLVDQLHYKDELHEHFTDLMGKDNFDDVTFISLKKYDSIQNENLVEKLKKDKIAVVYAQGEIVSGGGSETTIGSDRISKAIRKARKDEKVKAIVLRVNSPGGSALASDVIWREMKLAQKKKPVVVSMGDVAASGGYYIACGADKIYASPNSITGSIGVFGILMNVEELLTDKLGLTFDQVKTNKFSDMGSINRPLSKEEYDIIHESVVHIYEDFILKVAEGRQMNKLEVDNIGQGRVWSGSSALKTNLIDEFGGLEDAIEEASILAKMEHFQIYELPKQQEPFQKLLSQLKEGVKTSWVKSQLGNQYKYYKSLEDLKNLKGVQARMPYQFVID